MRKDLTGRKFGKLTVLRQAGRDNHRNIRWLCIWECGGENTPTTTTLLRGKSSSCGCAQIKASRRKLRTGSRFGRLKVLQFSKIVNHRSVYLCKCDCGKETEVQLHRLIQGITTSCGCYRKEIHTKHGLSGTPEYAVLCAAKRRARKLKARGSHTHKDILDLFEEQGGLCYYCEVELGPYHRDHKIPLSRGGSDSKENLCLACPSCNCRKYNRTDKEFTELMSYKKA